jgi:hypothetical protein
MIIEVVATVPDGQEPHCTSCGSYQCVTVHGLTILLDMVIVIFFQPVRETIEYKQYYY